MPRDRTFNDMESACRWACDVFGCDDAGPGGDDAVDPPPAADPDPPTAVETEGTTAVDEEGPDGLLVTRREDDREFADMLSDSPWERMLREATMAAADRPN